MTVTARTYIDHDWLRVVRCERDMRERGRNPALAGAAKPGALLCLCFGAGCSALVGFKDVTLDSDGGTADASNDAPGDVIDSPPPKIYAFHTDQSFAGNFGGAAARTAADTFCQNKYNAAFQSLGCAAANIHAFVQIDDVTDTLARLDVNYPIPQMSQVVRATDGTTPIATNWSAFVSPSAQLLSPISTSATPVTFWSGRAPGGNLQCANWTSNSSAVSGNSGDATKVNAWTATSNQTCNNFNQKLVCFCW